MAPKAGNESTIVQEDDTAIGEANDKLTMRAPPMKYEIVWIVVAYISYLIPSSMYGLYLGITSAMWTTIAFTFVMIIISNLGITAGVHRLWTHKAYKAKLPLQIFLMLSHSTTNTFTAIKWVRDHTLHHKYSDTDADPHNSTRGFFYCHGGYSMLKKNSLCKAKGKLLDLSELYANPVLRFQQKHAVWLITSLAYIIPSLVPLLWNEQFSVAFHMNQLRVLIALNVGSMINSFAHMYGTRPYDKTILPAQNKLLSFLTLGEGFHNYHHVFPQDYRAAELGDNYLNPTTKFIDFCAWIGLAYDLRYATDEIIEARMRRTGEPKSVNLSKSSL